MYSNPLKQEISFYIYTTYILDDPLSIAYICGNNLNLLSMPSETDNGFLLTWEGQENQSSPR